jgi:CBS domain-containing protein
MIPVKEVMNRNVITFREDTPLEEIASTLVSRRITGAPVVSSEGHVVGIVSETDVFSKKGKTARDIMSQRVISVTEETGIDEAARLLIGERIRRVPVIRGGKMVGLLSRSDVLDFFAKTRWTCKVCGWWERSLEKPDRCYSCSSTDLTLERADPGH